MTAWLTAGLRRLGRARVTVVVWGLDEGPAEETLASLARRSGYDFELVVARNGVPAVAGVERLAGRPGRDVSYEGRRSIGEFLNLVADHVSCDVIVLVRAGTKVLEDWLRPLVDELRRPGVGMATPRLGDEPAGYVLGEGTLLPTDRVRTWWRRRVDVPDPSVVAIRMDAFDAVQGFDQSLDPSPLVLADLSLRMAQHGLATVAVGAAALETGAHSRRYDEAFGRLQQESLFERWATAPRRDRTRTSPMGPAAGSRGTAAAFTQFALTTGGGERYLLTLIETLVRAGFATGLATPGPNSRRHVSALALRLGVSIPALDLVSAGDLATVDLFFAMGNEILPPLRNRGRKGVFICQFPFPDADESEERLAWLGSYDEIWAYSEFAADAIRRELSRLGADLPVVVVSPPTDLLSYDPALPKNGIVSVGRFFTGGHSKRQDVLIEAFGDLVGSGVDTTLHLVGSSSLTAENVAYLSSCRELAAGLPVQFHVDASRSAVTQAYLASSVYWHAAGFGVDVTQHPERCEHFGISVVEAMSAGTIPVVVGNGGPASIVVPGTSGMHYSTKAELVAVTRRLLESPPVGMRAAAAARAGQFSRVRFETACRAAVDRLLG